MIEHTGPLDLSKDSKKKSQEEINAKSAESVHQVKPSSRPECRCPFCGKMFSRPWLLKGKLKRFEDKHVKLNFI